MSEGGDVHNRFQGEAENVVLARDIGAVHFHGTAPTGVASTAASLAQMVELQWKTEAKLRSLPDPDPIPVGWRLRPSLSDHPDNVDPPGKAPTWENASSGDISALTERFRATRRRRLVIIGGPGSGKTTLAVQLLLHLLKTRRSGEPVPVLLPIAGWDTGRFKTLQAWLEHRLPRDYPALRSSAYAPTLHALVAGSHILPVLDGLDEMPSEAQTGVIAALRRSLGDDDQLILTSRTTEFREAAAGTVLTSAAVLQARPLPPATVADYLRRSLPPKPGPAWRTVLNGLQSGTAPWDVLASVTATPLGVWLLREVYTAPGADPAELEHFPDSAALRAHLFDQLAAAVIATRPPADDPREPFRPKRQYDPRDVERWLGFLADHLTRRQHTRDLAWWLLTKSAFDVPVVQGIAGLPVDADVSHPYSSSMREWNDPKLARMNLTLSGRTRTLFWKLALWSPLGLVIGALGTLWFWFTGWRSAAIPVWVTIGVTCWLRVAVVSWAEVPVTTTDASTPMSSWRADRAVALCRIYVAILAAALTGMVAFGLAYGWLMGLAAALLAGAVSGLVGLAFPIGEDSAWSTYVTVARRLARTNGLPRDLIGFLDDAHKLGLLRIVGPIYQFRHAEYQDHLADRHESWSNV